MSNSRVEYQAGLILVRDGEHRCAKCQEELPGLKAHINHISKPIPDEFFKELQSLCDALGVPCPDGRSSPQQYMQKCTAVASRNKEGTDEQG